MIEVKVRSENCKKYVIIQSVIAQTILILFGALLFLFSFWRRLKDDYFDNQVFTTGFYVLFAMLISNGIFSYFAPAFWFWSSILGILIGVGLGSYRYKMRFFEIIEAAVGSSFVPLILIFLYNGIKNHSPVSFFVIAGVMALLGFYYFLSTNYKKISWYKSGKVGFAGMSVSALFFVLRALLAIWVPSMISLSSYDWIFSIIGAIISLAAIIHLTYKAS